MSLHDHEPAFAQPCTSDGYASNTSPGMDLRDYFAAKAITGKVGTVSHAAEIAIDAYAIADAMMEVRKV